MSSAVGSLLTMLYFNLCVADLIEYSGHCGEGVTGLDWHQPLSQKGPCHVFELFCLVEGIVSFLCNCSLIISREKVIQMILDYNGMVYLELLDNEFELFSITGIYLAILMRCCSVSLIGLINHLDNL